MIDALAIGYAIKDRRAGRRVDTAPSEDDIEQYVSHDSAGEEG